MIRSLSLVRLCAVCAVLAVALGWSHAARAQEGGDAQLKAAFLFNFARFVEWPPERFATRETQFQICTIGRDGLGATLDSLAGKSAQSREVRVRRGLAPADIAGCHIVFVAEQEDRRFSSVQRAAREGAVLVVGESEGFCEAGGMIGLVPVEGKMQFEINLGATRAAGLKVPSQVLRLARTVIQGGSRP